MSSEDLLSRDEIDALLHVVDKGAVGDSPARAPEGVRPYALHEQEHFVRGRLPTLELVNERFLRAWRHSLSRQLRRPVEVSAQPVETLRFGEYTASLRTPSNLNRVRVKPLRGNALFVFDAALVRSAVDHYFGGSGSHPGAGAGQEAREFTAMEMRVVQLLLQQAFSDLVVAWAPAMPLEFEYLDSETNPLFANVATPREHAVVCRYPVELEGGSGCLDIVLPWAMLEPVRDVLAATLQGDRAERDETWSRALRGSFIEADVEALGTLATVRTSLGRVLRYRTGDIIPVDIPDSVPLSIDGVPVFRGKFGVANGRNAVRITEIINRSALAGETARTNRP